MEAIVLAGGLGTRLRDVVNDVPKPMAPVQGRPFLSFVFDQLVAAGFNSVIVAAGYRHEAISSYFANDYRGLAVSYSVEGEPLGTGGAISLACERSHEQHVFVLNGDTYLELDFHAMLRAHISRGAELTMAICRVPDLTRYGAVDLRGDIVQVLAEKGHAGPGWINAGTYLLAPPFRARLQQRTTFSLERDLLAPEIGRIRPLAFRTPGPFMDIGIPADYATAQRLLSERRRP